MGNRDAVVGLPAGLTADSFVLDGRRLRLGANASGRLDVLEGAARQGVPVYAEFDPTTSLVTRMFLPRVTRVRAFREMEGGLAVEVELSRAVHVLSRQSPEYERFDQLLRESLTAGLLLVVTEDDARTIIDVRAFRPGVDGVLPLLGDELPQPQRGFFDPARKLIAAAVALTRKWRPPRSGAHPPRR